MVAVATPDTQCSITLNRQQQLPKVARRCCLCWEHRSWRPKLAKLASAGSNTASLRQQPREDTLGQHMELAQLPRRSRLDMGYGAWELLTGRCARQGSRVLHVQEVSRGTVDIRPVHGDGCRRPRIERSRPRAGLHGGRRGPGRSPAFLQQRASTDGNGGR
jgi:hypothetical protein